MSEIDKIEPEKRNYLLQLGLAYGQMERPGEAVTWYKRAVAAFERDGEPMPGWLPLTIAASFLFHMDPRRPRDALPFLDAVMNGSCPEEERDKARSWYVWVYHYLGDNDTFLTLAREYISAGLDGPTIRVFCELVAHLLYERGEFAESYAYARRRGEDYWITRNLAPRLVTIAGRFRLAQIMETIYRRPPSTFYLPLPMDTPYQKLVSFESNPAPLRTIRAGRYATAEYDFSSGYPVVFELEMVVRNRVTEHKPRRLETFPDGAGDLGYYAHYRDAYFDFGAPVISNRVAAIVGGVPDTLLQVKAIHDWVSDDIVHILTLDEYKSTLADGRLQYDTAKIPDYSRISEIMQNKVGHCRHISELFTGMVRSLQVPVRVISGITIDSDGTRTEGICGGHFVAEIFDPDENAWFYVEPQFKSFFGANQFWHIVTGAKITERRYDNVVSLASLRWVEHYELGNPACLTYSVQFE